MGFQEQIESYLEHIEHEQMFSVHTVNAYRRDLKKFTTFLDNSNISELHNVDYGDLVAFLKHMDELGYASISITRTINAARSLFRFLIKEGIMEEHVILDLPIPKSGSSIPDIGSYFGYRDRCMLELLYSSALRVSELVQLNRTDIDFGRMVITIHGKGDISRQVPITDTAADWLKNYLNHQERKVRKGRYQGEVDPDAVFLNKDGKRLSTRSVGRKFEDYLDVLGLKGKVSPHTIRHTIATHWLENGMDIHTIKLLLGHKSFSTTTIYTQVTQKLKKAAYDKAFGEESE